MGSWKASAPTRWTTDLGPTVTCAPAATRLKQEHQRSSATSSATLCWDCRRAIEESGDRPSRPKPGGPGPRVIARDRVIRSGCFRWPVLQEGGAGLQLSSEDGGFSR